MTTIITRLYKDDATAKAVTSGLSDAGFPEKTFDMIGGSGDAGEAMAKAQVPETSAAAYAPLVSQGNKLVVVRAPFVPFGAAKQAQSIVDSQPTVDAGIENENVFVSDELPEEMRNTSILRDHPRFLTSAKRPRPTTISEALGIRLLSSPRKRTSAVGQEGHWSTPIAPIPLIDSNPRKSSVFSGTRRFADFAMRLIWKQDRGLSVKKGGGTPFSDVFGIPLLIKR